MVDITVFSGTRHDILSVFSELCGQICRPADSKASETLSHYNALGLVQVISVKTALITWPTPVRTCLMLLDRLQIINAGV